MREINVSDLFKYVRLYEAVYSKTKGCKVPHSLEVVGCYLTP